MMTMSLRIARADGPLAGMPLGIGDLLTCEPPLDGTAIRERLWEWAKLPQDEALAELGAVQDAVRRRPTTIEVVWAYQQALLALMGSLLAMRPELRFVIAEVHDELGL